MTGLYLILGLVFTTSIVVTFVVSSVLAHQAIWPLLSKFSLSLDATVLGLLALGIIIVSLFAWVAPYVMFTLLSPVLVGRRNFDRMPSFYSWALIAVPIALVLEAGLWFTRLGSGTAFLPASLEYNVQTFTIIALPMAVAYSMLIRDELVGDAESSFKTSPSPSSQERATKTAAGNPGDNPASEESRTSTETVTQGVPDTTETHSEREPKSRDTSTVTATPTVANLEYDWDLPTEPTFDDVGGLSGIKSQLQEEVIAPLQGDTEKYRKFGVAIPDILFHGPPGTGKTFLAEALAGELQTSDPSAMYPFVKLSAANLTSKWVNESTDLVGSLFDEAAQLGRQYEFAIIFVDEIDALLPSRDANNQNQENKKVVNEFLNQLSETTERNILFIGATNNFDELDDAAIRSGRISKKIHIGMPDQETRAAIIEAQYKQRPSRVPTSQNLSHFAAELEGKSAADIERLVDAAARRALNRDASRVEAQDLAHAIDDQD